MVDYLWLERRADKLGISIDNPNPPQAFYLLNTASRRDLSLLAPAPADIGDVPFRADTADSILGLLKGRGAEKVVVVFTQTGDELRRAVAPQLVSKIRVKRTPHLYLRVAPQSTSRLDVKPTEGTDIIPVDHKDLFRRSVEEVSEGSILGKKTGKGVLYNSEAVVYHKVRRSKLGIGTLLRRSFYQGYSKAMMDRMNISPDAMAAEGTYLRALLRERVPRRLVRCYRLREIERLFFLIACVACVGSGYAYARALRVGAASAETAGSSEGARA